MDAELKLVRQLSDEGKTSELLFLAVQNGRLSSIGTLLSQQTTAKSKHSLLSSVDPRGATPLHVACESGHIDVIRSLLAAGAPCTPLFKQHTPLQLAVASATSTEPFQTALLQAVCAGDLDSIVDLLHGGVDPNSHHVLCWAVDLGHHHVVVALLEASADVNLARSGSTPLHLALMSKNQDIVKTLLAVEETDLTFKDTSGVTPQELASTLGMSLALPPVTSADSDVSSKESNETTTKALHRKVLDVERQLEEQKNLVAGLRDMLNTVLSDGGVQQLVGHLQSELVRVKREGQLLAESAFKLKATRDGKIERMCSSSIAEEHAGGGASSETMTQENGEASSSTLGYFFSMLGLQAEEKEDQKQGNFQLLTVPKCASSGHTMVVSSTLAEGYSAGYSCDECGRVYEDPKDALRWNCFQCTEDYCFECRPQPNSMNVPGSI